MIDWIKVGQFVIGRILARATAYNKAAARYAEGAAAAHAAGDNLTDRMAEAHREASRLRRVAGKLESALK